MVIQRLLIDLVSTLLDIVQKLSIVGESERAGALVLPHHESKSTLQLAIFTCTSVVCS